MVYDSRHDIPYDIPLCVIIISITNNVLYIKGTLLYRTINIAHYIPHIIVTRTYPN
jgi:hypothetical protein